MKKFNMIVVVLFLIFSAGCKDSSDYEDNSYDIISGAWRTTCKDTENGSFHRSVYFSGSTYEQSFYYYQNSNCIGSSSIYVGLGKISYVDSIVSSVCQVEVYDVYDLRERETKLPMNDISGSVCLYQGKLFLGDVHGEIDFTVPFNKLPRGGVVSTIEFR